MSKFNEYDRKATIRELESRWRIKLTQIGNRRKYLEDETGKRYCVLGGYEDWHGIPKDIDRAEQSRNNSMLVLAVRYRQTIDVYYGPLNPLLQNKHLLTETKDSYQFNVKHGDNRLLVKQVPGFSLEMLSEISYPESDKEADTRLKDVKALLSGLSPKEREELLKELGDS